MTSSFSWNLIRMAMAVLRPSSGKCCGRIRFRSGSRCLNCPVKRSQQRVKGESFH